MRKKTKTPATDETPVAATPESEKTPAAPVCATRPTVRWDDSRLTSVYANVANVSSTREEIVMVLGVNQTWAENQPQVTIQLTHRLILTPATAKRLSALLDRVVVEYEERFGSLARQDANGEAAA